MRCVLTLAGATDRMCAGVACGAAHGQDGKGEPFELVRSLQSLQDQVVRGNTRAHAAQRVLLARIAEQFDALERREVEGSEECACCGGVRAERRQRARAAEADAQRRKHRHQRKAAQGHLGLRRGPARRSRRAAGERRGAYARSRHGRASWLTCRENWRRRKSPQRPWSTSTMRACCRPARSSRRPRCGARLPCSPQPATPIATRRWRRSICADFPNSVYAGGFRQQFAVAIAVHTDAGEPGRLDAPGEHAGRRGPVGPARGVSHDRQGGRRQGQDGDGEIRRRKCAALDGGRAARIGSARGSTKARP